MLIKNLRTFVLTLIFFGLSDILCYSQKDLKTYSAVVTGNNEKYTVNAGGTLQPENIELIIENIGEDDIINPVITINDKWNWSTPETVVREIINTSSASTDEEKALAIWSFITDNRYHWQPPGDNLDDPIKFLNVYGFGFCGQTAYITDVLCKAAGLKSRHWSLGGHGVHEVFYNGQWHILDGQTMAFYLNRDNLTIAGIDQIAEDPWLVERTMHPVADMWRKSHPRRARDISETMYSREQFRKTIARWYSTTENNRARDARTAGFHDMNLVLRPGEKLVLRWDNCGKWYNNFLYNEPPLYANGKIIYSPDFTKNDYRKGMEYEGNVKSVSDDGFMPNLHVDSSVVEIRKYHDYADNDIGHVVYKVESPYVIVGGKIGGQFYRNDNFGDVCRMLISFDGDTWIPVWTAKTTGHIEHYQIIDDIISPIGEDPKYKYYVKAEFRAAGHGLDPPQESGDITHAGINSFKIETDFQVSPFSIPMLSAGLNEIRYFDDTEGERKVKITHTWNEHYDSHYPNPPARSIFPADGGKIKTSAPVLKWDKATDPDENSIIIDFGRKRGAWTESSQNREIKEGDKITGYHVQVSLRPDCKWPLCPDLDVDTNSEIPEFRIPDGWLVSGQTYFWRVKARDSSGNWSEYGEIWEFVTDF